MNILFAVCGKILEWETGEFGKYRTVCGKMLEG